MSLGQFHPLLQGQFINGYQKNVKIIQIDENQQVNQISGKSYKKNNSLNQLDINCKTIQIKQLAYKILYNLYQNKKPPFVNIQSVIEFNEEISAIIIYGNEFEINQIETQIEKVQQGIRVKQLLFDERDLLFLISDCKDDLEYLEKSQICYFDQSKQQIVQSQIKVLAQGTFKQKKLLVVQGNVSDIQVDVIVNHCGSKLCLSYPQDDFEKEIQNKFGQLFINFCIDYLQLNNELQVGQVAIYSIPNSQQVKFIYNVARTFKQKFEEIGINRNLKEIFKLADFNKVKSICIPIFGISITQSCSSNLLKLMMSQIIKYFGSSNINTLYILDNNQSKVQEIVNELINLNSQCISLYKWFWQDDNNNYVQYNNVQNIEIDLGYQEYLKDNTKNKIRINILKNNQPIQYEITFNLNQIIQVNLQTSFQRQVIFKDFRIEQIYEPYSQWQWERKGKFNNYPKNINNQIDQAYRIYLNNKTQQILNFMIKNKNYQVIFEEDKVIQKNCKTKYCRNIRSIPYIYYQWQWIDQQNNTYNHDFEVNQIIDQAYQEYLIDSKKNTINICICEEEEPIQYQIKFVYMPFKQINIKNKNEFILQNVPYQRNLQSSQQEDHCYEVEVFNNNDKSIEITTNLISLKLQYYENETFKFIQEQLNQIIEKNRTLVCHIIPQNCSDLQLKAQVNLINQFAINEQKNVKQGDQLQIQVYKQDVIKLTALLQNFSKYQSHDVLKQLSKINSDNYPQEWCPQVDNLVKIKLDDNNSEYIEIEKLFKQTYNGQVHRIYRIQNKSLYKNYIFEQNNLIDQAKDKYQQLTQLETERYLWHGVKSQHPKIIYESKKNAFDGTYANSGMWGPGIYFAENASYSKSYSFQLTAQSESDSDLAGKLVFLCCKVCTGKLYQCQSDGSLKRPPAGYDAVTGFTGGSNVFILYQMDIRRAYPAYEVIYS